MTNEPHVLPLVLRMRQQIDEVFTRYVGPIAVELGDATQLSQTSNNEWPS